MKTKKLMILLIVVFLYSFFSMFTAISISKDCDYVVSHPLLDFHQCTISESPSMHFFILNFWEQFKNIEGKIKPSVTWINVSPSEFKGRSTEIQVKLDLSTLSSGLYRETIEIISDYGNFSLPVRVDVVEKTKFVSLVFDSPYVIANHERVVLSAAPYVARSIPYLPLRVICDTFGATIQYNADTRHIMILYENNRIEIPRDQNYVIVNGERRNLCADCTPEIRNYSTFLPMEFFQEVMNLQIYRHYNLRAVTIE